MWQHFVHLRQRHEPQPTPGGVDVYEFLVPGPPVSAQANDRLARRRWKERVRDAAMRVAPEIPVFWNPGVRLTVVHLYHEAEIDVDNILKPSQDGLELVFYPDDSLVTDVDGHRRWVQGDYDTSSLPVLLQRAWIARTDCVYVRVASGAPLENLL